MIYIIITTCIIDKYEMTIPSDREKRYCDCIQQLLNLIQNDSSIKPIIVENNGVRKTYLDNFKCEVCYNNNNNTQNTSHKGVTELLDIKDVINRYNIQDDDIVIKLTGRYKMLDLIFVNLVKKCSNDYDAFIKFFNVCEKKFVFNDCVLGLFAIKCKYLKNFNYKCIKSPECEFAEYLRENITKISEIKQLNLECCFAQTPLDLLIV